MTAQGSLGRVKYIQTVQNSATDIFKAKAVRLADETDAAFNLRAADFGRRAGLEQLNGRSGAVARLFESQFGAKAGKDLFKSQAREVQGGLLFNVANKTLGNVNAGGYTTRAVAEALNIPYLPKATDWAVKAFQNSKNTLRADAIKTPIVRNVVHGVNWLLNNIGQGGKVWQSVVKGAVAKADEKDVLNAYAGLEAIDVMKNLRNVRMEYMEPTKQLITDLSRMKPKTVLGFTTQVGDQVAYDVTQKLLRDPDYAAAFVPANVSEEKALNMFNAFRDDYDRWHKLFTENGFDVQYMDNYLPLMYAKDKKDFDKFAEIFTAGPKNIPSNRYNPEIARTKWMRTIIDPDTGIEKVVPMTHTQIKDTLIKMGEKDLADSIIDDPEVLLARYATNASRLLADKKLVSDLVNTGVLFKSVLPVLDTAAADIDTVLATLTPVQLKKITETFAETDGNIANYVTKINDDLLIASRTNDEVLRKSAYDRIDSMMESLVDARNILTRRVSSTGKKLSAAEEVQDSEALLTIKPTLDKLLREHNVLQTEIEKLRALGTDAGNKMADDLALRSNNGIEYLAVGSGKGETYNLPKEFAELHGERALVEAINRRLLVQSNSKEADKYVTNFAESHDIMLAFWRTAATFGKFAGFVLRNAVGAIQNNVMLVGANAADHRAGSYITRVDMFTDRALMPFAQLSRTDLSYKRLEKLADKGKLNKVQVQRFKDDIESYGYVRSNTVSDTKQEVLESILSKKTLEGSEATYWDIYKAAVQGRVFDRYSILPTMQTADAASDEGAYLLARDPDRFTLGNKVGNERGIIQRGGETILNTGITIPADIAGRNIRLEPFPPFTMRTTRSLNQRTEEFARTSAIAAGLRRYGNNEGGVKSAILSMHAAQFDYSDLSEVERIIFRRIMPFWTWSKNNVPTQFRSLINDPTRIQRNLAGWEAVSNIFADENGDAIIIPDYVSEMYGFVLDEDIRKEIIKKSPAWLKDIMDNPIGVATAGLTPTTDLERWTAGLSLTNPQAIFGTEAAKQAYSSNPITKALIQWNTNTSLYTKRQYKDVEAPGWYVQLTNQLDKIIPGGYKGGIKIDPETGGNVVSGNALDQWRTVIPLMAPFEKNALGVLDIIVEANTGKPSNLSGTLDSKTAASLFSTFTGITTVAITPEVQAGQLSSQIIRRDDAMNAIAGAQGVDIKKLNKAITNLNAKGYTNEQILLILEDMRNAGQLNAEWLSALQP